MNPIDFEKDQEEVLSRTENISKLAEKVKELQGMGQSIEMLEESLKTTKKDYENLSGEVIPTMMSEMGLSQLRLMDGSSLEVKPYYTASISIKNRETAYNWLRNNDLGDIIKNEISVSFGRGDANLAKSQGFEPTQKLKVEPMTLKALVRERIEAGKDMPMDTFNVFVGNRTKLTMKQ